MIVFLLLVIIAILLFGSSVVLRGIGLVLGSIVGLIAVAVGLSMAEQIPSWVWWTLGLVVGGGIAAIFVLDARQQARVAAMNAQLQRDLEEIRERGLSDVERIRAQALRDPKTVFYNDGLNAKKRKRMARQDGVDHDARRRLLAPENRRMRMDLLAKRPRDAEPD